MTTMQDEHKELLQSNRVFLIDNLTDVDGVLNYLVEKKIFRGSMAEEIQAPRTRRGKVEELLNRLPRRGPRAFPTFLEALRVREETSCAGRLAGAQGDGAKQVPPPTPAPPTQDKTAMEEEHKGLLRSNRVFLTENLTDVDGVLDHLVENTILSEPIKEEIEAALTRRGKIRQLLDLLPRRGPRAFHTFVGALTACEEKECAARLTVGPGGDAAREVPQPVQATPDVEEEDLPDTWPDSSRASSEVKLLRCQEVPTSRTLMEKIIKKNKVYPMLSPVRGYCYIINNHKFSQAGNPGKDLSNRTGTNKDCEGLKEVFSQLGFRPVIRPDLKASDMQNFLKEAAKKDHSKMDCLVVFVLSHGAEGTVLGVDGEPVIVREIRQQFNGKGCPSMAGKPKLIFIAACQGNEEDGGVARTLTGSQPSDSVGCGQMSDQFQRLQLRDAVGEGKGAEVSDAVGESTDASDAHILRMLATHPGKNSWRDVEDGTWFIQAIIHVFKRFSHSEDLNGMMTMVNKLVNKAETEQGMKQAPWFSSSLVEKLYFFPGLCLEGSELKEYSPPTETCSTTTPEDHH